MKRYLISLIFIFAIKYSISQNIGLQYSKYNTPNSEINEKIIQEQPFDNNYDFKPSIKAVEKELQIFKRNSINSK
jgi:hypothetical protein